MSTARTRLEMLRHEDLGGVHAAGQAPDPTALHGVMDGLVLTSTVLRELRLWRGKVFETRTDGSLGGLNRLGFGLLEVRRYRFTAYVSPSLFGDRDVLLLDHDTAANPPYIRRFHDELVQVEHGLFLATSHYRVKGELRFAAYFALVTAAPASSAS